MSKLATSNECLPLIEVVDRLRVSLAKPCTPADVLQLGLENRLVLSVRFLSPVSLLLRSTATLSGKPKKGSRPRHVGQRRTTTPADIWDLAWVGSEHAIVEALRQSWTGGGLSIPRRAPAYVTSRDGDMWEVPPPGLLHDCELVVRSDALAALEANQAASTERQDSDLGTREKRTLLTTIFVMSSLDKIDLAERGSQKKIVATSELLGLKLSAATVSRIVKEVREAVEDRRS
jgi:hypothetical protein